MPPVKAIEAMDTIGSNRDGVHLEEGVHEREINHLHGISQSNSNLLTESQIVRIVNLSSLDEVQISCWNTDIDWERESDWEAEVLELQS